MSKMLLVSILVGITMIVAAVLFTSQPTQAFDPIPGCYPCGECPCGTEVCLNVFGIEILCADCPACDKACNECID